MLKKTFTGLALAGLLFGFAAQPMLAASQNVPVDSDGVPIFWSPDPSPAPAAVIKAPSPPPASSAPAPVVPAAPAPVAPALMAAAAAPAAAPAPAAPPALPAGVPPAPLATGKVILVSLGLEKLFAYLDGNLVGQTLVTTGGPRTRTPAGNYSVLQKRRSFMMTSPWPEDDWRWYEPSFVNYALLFESSGYFIHDAPWRHNFGPGSNAQFGEAGGDVTGTHGCVNVPLDFEANLFNWSDIGTPVFVVA